MNNTSKDPADDGNKQDNLSALQAGESTTQSNWFGPFSLLRSPLSFVVTIVIMFVVILAAQHTQNLKISILTGVVIELLAIVVIWQYLQLSRRLDDITNRTVNLQNLVTDPKQSSGSSKAAHGYTHRLLGTMSGDQSRILQSSEEFKRAIKLICDHIDIFCNHIEDWRKQDLEHLEEITNALTTFKSETSAEFGLMRESIRDSNQNAVSEVHTRLASLVHSSEERQQQAHELFTGKQIANLLESSKSAQTKLKASMAGQVQKSLIELRESLTVDLPEKTALAFDDRLLAQSQEVEVTLTKLGGQIGILNDHLSTVKSDLSDLAERESNISLAQSQEVEVTLTKLGGQIGILNDHLSTVKSDLSDLAERESNISLAQSQEVEVTLTKLGGQIGILNDHLSTVKSDLSDLAERESNISKALDVSTALDRLNLEVRRQLAELRAELNN